MMKKIVFFVLIIATVLMFTGCTTTEVRTNNVSQTDTKENLVVLQHNACIRIKSITDLQSGKIVYEKEGDNWLKQTYSILLQPGKYMIMTDVQIYQTDFQGATTMYSNKNPIPLIFVATKNESYEFVSNLDSFKQLQVNIKKIEKN